MHGIPQEPETGGKEGIVEKIEKDDVGKEPEEEAAQEGEGDGGEHPAPHAEAIGKDEEEHGDELHPLDEPERVLRRKKERGKHGDDRRIPRSPPERTPPSPGGLRLCGSLPHGLIRRSGRPFFPAFHQSPKLSNDQR